MGWKSKRINQLLPKSPQTVPVHVLLGGTNQVYGRGTSGPSCLLSREGSPNMGVLPPEGSPNVEEPPKSAFSPVVPPFAGGQSSMAALSLRTSFLCFRWAFICQVDCHPHPGEAQPMGRCSGGGQRSLSGTMRGKWRLPSKSRVHGRASPTGWQRVTKLLCR